MLNIAFRIADEQHLPLLDLKDLRLLLNEMTKDDGLKPAATHYGNVADATVGSILRQLLVLENQGADKFFGEPALDIKDFMRDRPRRPRHHQCAGRRQADGQPAALRHVPAVDAVGAVRAAARGGRPR